jgi:malate synthase
MRMTDEEIKKLSNDELEKKINETRVNSYVPSSIYHKLVAERQSRNDERLNTQQKIAEGLQEKLIEQQEKLLESHYNLHNTVRDGLKEIIFLLSKNNNLWKALGLVIVIPIFVGVSINVLTDIIHKLLPWLISH